MPSRSARISRAMDFRFVQAGSDCRWGNVQCYDDHNANRAACDKSHYEILHGNLQGRKYDSPSGGMC
jgi:hypothetical protein